VQVHAFADVGQTERAFALAEQVKYGYGAVEALQLIRIAAELRLVSGFLFGRWWSDRGDFLSCHS
jgi:hypothetical protein